MKIYVHGFCTRTLGTISGVNGAERTALYSGSVVYICRYSLKLHRLYSYCETAHGVRQLDGSKLFHLNTYSTLKYSVSISQDTVYHSVYADPRSTRITLKKTRNTKCNT